jgi:hypothetical protein
MLKHEYHICDAATQEYRRAVYVQGEFSNNCLARAWEACGKDEIPVYVRRAD